MLYPPSQNIRPNSPLNYSVNALYFSNQPEVNLATTKVGTLSLDTRGPIGTGMYVNWGDGSASEWIAHLGTGISVVTNHNYIGAGTKDIKFTGRLDLVTTFTCIDPTVTGSISVFPTFTSLTTLQIHLTSISGDVSGISSMISLTTLRVDDTLVTGSVSSFSALVNLTLILIKNTAINGDIAGVSTLVNLTFLRFDDSAVTGDIGDLYTLYKLTTFFLKGNALDYSTSTLPAWNSCGIQIQDCGLDSTEVDNFLIDLAAAGGTNGTLNIAGTNAARTSASDAAKATLLANGWALTVNE